MTKRRRVKKNVASKVDAVNKDKTPVEVKTSEKDAEKATCVETPQPSDAKKQKLDTTSSRTDSSSETEKYVPPFTASQRVVRVPRDKLQLNKTKLNSQENSSTDEGKELKRGETANNNKENKIYAENNTDVTKEPVEENEQQEDDSVRNEKLESKEVEISASNSLGDDKEKATNVAEYDKDKEPILKTNESVKIPDKPLLVSDQMIVNKELLSNDAEVVKFKSQADEEKPVNYPKVVKVPKLSFIIKKYYVDIEPDQEIKNVEPTTILINTSSNHKASEKVEEIEKDEEKEIGSTEHEGSESKSMNMVDDQILHQPSATVPQNPSTSPQNDCKKQVIVSASAKTECVQQENGKNATTENISTDLAKNDEDEQNDDQSKVSLTSDDLVDQQTADQIVPGDVVVQECQTVVSGCNTTQVAVDPDEKKTALSCLNESNCEKTKANEAGGVMISVVKEDVVDEQSFAKEFEELEELLPKDDMGLFDDVMDDQSTSDDIEIPNGDSTMQFLIDELSSLNYMVMNYQRTTDEMKRQYKLSNRC